ncbi:MAG: peptidoglycan bridge formation glycyltransferase FemA/FemB family protein, partial [Ignavibacteriaceae bacterium]
GMVLTATIQLDENIDLKTEKEFLNSIIEIIKQKKLCDWIQQSPNWAIFNSPPNGADSAPFGTYKISLQGKSTEELFNSIQTKDRSDIRKAIKEGVEIKSGFNLLNEAMALISATAEKADISLPSKEELHYLKENIQVLISYYQTVPQSSAIFYTNKYAWYNMYAGTKDKPFRGSNSLLYWSAIKSAREKSVLFFDLVGAQINPDPGSKQEKIQRFKEHFGVELFKGYMWKMPISKFKYYMYDYLIKTFFLISRRKFKGDIIDRERNRQLIL